tara:strand:+ start:6896 stop:8383 length:1488 start_codon:yes stop_codon:yes gene_type:complete
MTPLEKTDTKEDSRFMACAECHGRGKKSRRVRKKARLQYQREIAEFEKNPNSGKAPEAPKGHLYPCETCNGTGLIPAKHCPPADRVNYPELAIIGGGIGGVALAVACLHRGIPFTLYERDHSFDQRSQGYGLTLQQASKAMAGLGLQSLEEGIISTRHVVHNTEGKVLGEWGMRKWLEAYAQTNPRRTNIHIARQSLRLALLQQLQDSEQVKWGHQFVGYTEKSDRKLDLRFQIDGTLKSAQADLIVGADGIRSAVRNTIIGEETSPLNYLDCIVILGICPLCALSEIDSPLLDSATVFQTANGQERIYMMPFNAQSIMWQLSFPMSEKEAKELSSKGPQALKAEAQLRTQWHKPIPQIMAATEAAQISGYPVYDRQLLKPELLQKAGAITLIGDAAHPMSPFKGQGANQALLDALALAREISRGCKATSDWRNIGLRERVLNAFEAEMIARTAVKVKDSAAAAEFLHSDEVLREADAPRGKHLKQEKNNINSDS